MRKQVITTDRIEKILEGKDDSFLFNDGYYGSQTKILIKNCEFGYFNSGNKIDISYELVFEDCTFMQPFTLNAISNKSIEFKGTCYFDEILYLRATCPHLTLHNLVIKYFSFLFKMNAK